MDDLNLYKTSDNQLNWIANTVKKVSDDIKREIRLDTFASATFNRVKKSNTWKIPMNDNQVIQDLDQTKIYKNLREVEGGVQHYQIDEDQDKEGIQSADHASSKIWT